MTKTTGNLVAYYRVSTDKQGLCGLGMESQEAAVRSYAERMSRTVIATFTEVETGRKSKRPRLTEALAMIKREKATLVVAKLDRLSRNMAFLSSLMESGCDFVALDCPDASRFTLHILAAVAEQEAMLISQRTKSALAVLKARGVKLGNPNGISASLGRKGAATNRQSAIDHQAMISPLMEHWRSQGATLDQIADRLNAKRVATRNGSQWTATQVKRVLDRAKPPISVTILGAK